MHIIAARLGCCDLYTGDPGWPEGIRTALFGFQSEVHLGGLAFLDFDFLGHHARFAVGGLDLVFPGRDIGDLERAVLAATAK